MSAGTPIDLGITQSASATQLILTTGADAPAGNLLLAFTGSTSASTGPSTITDDASNAYTVVSDGGGTSVSFGFKSAAGLLTSGLTITGNFGGAAAAHGLFAVSVPGISAAADPRDGGNGLSASGAATSASALDSGTLAQADEILFGVIGFSASPGAFTPGGNWILLKAEDTNLFFRVCYQIVRSTNSVTWAPTWVTSRNYKSRFFRFKGDGVGFGSTAGVGKAKNKGKRVWRVMLPDGKIVICDSPTEYYNLLTRAVNEPEPSVEEPVSTFAETLEIAAEPERPKQPLLKLRPAEKREAMNWAAAENMAVNLRTLADSIRAARTPIADNDDDEAAELLRWVI